MSTSLRNKNVVKKHVSSIHIEGKLSFLEKKLVNVFLLNAYDDLLTKRQHTIDIPTLCNMLGFDSKNIDYLKQALQQLVTTAITWDSLNDDGTNSWGVSSFLSYGQINKGVCTYEYSSALAEKLYHPDMYARINIGLQKKFSSGHTLSIYETCLRFKDVGSTGWIELSKFKSMLGINDVELYGTYKRLNERVLKPSIKEVNTASNIFIELDPNPKKEGRKISHIKFLIKDNPQYQLAIPDESPHTKSLAFQNLRDLKISDKLATQWIDEYGEKYVVEKLNYTEQQNKLGKIKKSKGAFLRVAVQEDWKDEEQEKLKLQKAKHEKFKKNENKVLKTKQEKEEQEKIKATQEREAVESYINNLNEIEFDHLKQEFEKSKSCTVIPRQLRNYDKPLFQAAFYRYILTKKMQNKKMTLDETLDDTSWANDLDNVL
jgi:hypothetical protein